MEARRSSLRTRVRRIIFGTDTPAGRAFDVALLILILCSVAIVMLETIGWIKAIYGTWLRIGEWVITALFTVEYGVRIWCATNRRRYITGFYGVVDLIAILPTYFSIIFPGTQALAMVRALRLTRVFRILDMVEYWHEAMVLLRSLIASRYRILSFMLAVLVMVSVFGTIMYLVESPEAGFTSIPRSIYWAIVTLTTVGYGDIAPTTGLGQAIASAIMILGYAIIAIPTGIISVEMVRQTMSGSTRNCRSCGTAMLSRSARFCHQCGHPLGGPEDAAETDDKGR